MTPPLIQSGRLDYTERSPAKLKQLTKRTSRKKLTLLQETLKTIQPEKAARPFNSQNRVTYLPIKT